MKFFKLSIRSFVAGTLLFSVVLYVQEPSPAANALQEQSGAVPVFEFDPTWPKRPLPNQWIFGNIAGVDVDEQDQIWVLHRGQTIPLDLGDNNAAQDPPVGECCRPAPSIVVFDQEGNVLQAWGGPDPANPKSKRAAEGYDWPREHGLFIDHNNNVWIGCDEGSQNEVISSENCATVTKFTQNGQLIFQKGKFGQSTGNTDTNNFNSPSSIFVDPNTNEAFIADGYRNQRVIVIDAETGAFKRLWGAYGNPNPEDIPRAQRGHRGEFTDKSREEQLAYDPTEPARKVFGDSLHCIELSRDGLVYVCDRGYNRIQVFERDGTFVREGFVAPQTRIYGSVFDIAFSPDPNQRFLYVADGANHKVHILRRNDLTVVGSFGNGGRAGGEFGVAHQLASDSEGNLYVGETVNRNRIQKFKFVGMRQPGS